MVELIIYFMLIDIRWILPSMIRKVEARQGATNGRS